MDTGNLVRSFLEVGLIGSRAPCVQGEGSPLNSKLVSSGESNHAGVGPFCSVCSGREVRRSLDRGRKAFHALLGEDGRSRSLVVLSSCGYFRVDPFGSMGCCSKVGRSDGESESSLVRVEGLLNPLKATSRDSLFCPFCRLLARGRVSLAGCLCLRPSGLGRAFRMFGCCLVSRGKEVSGSSPYDDVLLGPFGLG